MGVVRPGEDKLTQQEVKDVSDEGARTDGKGARVGKERGIMRIVWKRTRVMATGGEMEGRHGKGDDKMARKMNED